MQGGDPTSYAGRPEGAPPLSNSQSVGPRRGLNQSPPKHLTSCRCWSHHGISSDNDSETAANPPTPSTRGGETALFPSGEGIRRDASRRGETSSMVCQLFEDRYASLHAASGIKTEGLPDLVNMNGCWAGQNGAWRRFDGSAAGYVWGVRFKTRLGCFERDSTRWPIAQYICLFRY
jgi:hypothetical protein